MVSSIWLALIVFTSGCLGEELVTIETAGEKCFHRNVTVLSRIDFSFHVLEGGSLDVDVLFTYPDGELIHNFQMETTGNDSFVVYPNEGYTFCFRNIFTSVAPKLVEFSVETVAAPPSNEKTIRIAPLESFCFSENVTARTKLSLDFVVVEGGYLDIDLVLTDPDGQSLFSAERSSGDHYEFVADKKGMYKYCFSNELSNIVAKIVEYRIEIVPPGPVEDRTTRSACNIKEEGMSAWFLWPFYKLIFC